MRAARFHGRRDLRLEEIPEPAPGPGDVLLRVLYAGICGTDVHELEHGPIFTPGSTPHPLTGVVNPVVLGHELSGEVVAVGEEVTRVRAGDLVAVYPLETCGACPACAAGATNLCPLRAGHGLARGHGAFAELT
ncbi:MAG: butanediol dehydrogenase, partial [Actinobacteria bacterium]|nr:butanediol dehydrogenase [Actinomycetota bacterium]